MTETAARGLVMREAKEEARLQGLHLISALVVVCLLSARIIAGWHHYNTCRVCRVWTLGSLTVTWGCWLPLPPDHSLARWRRFTHIGFQDQGKGGCYSKSNLSLSMSQLQSQPNCVRPGMLVSMGTEQEKESRCQISPTKGYPSVNKRIQSMIAGRFGSPERNVCLHLSYSVMYARLSWGDAHGKTYWVSWAAAHQSMWDRRFVIILNQVLDRGTRQPWQWITREGSAWS